MSKHAEPEGRVVRLFDRAIISDLVLWLAVCLLIVGGFQWLREWESPFRGETIRLAFRDANELTRGSMVRMMGTEIGYVDRIDLKEDHVEVAVKTLPKALKIPSGSQFTIQFTGLVGAKSIEIIPPDIPRPTQRGEPLYLVEEPLRLKDNMHYQMDILQDLQQGAENLADFFGKKKPVEELQVNIRQSLAWSQASNRFLLQSADDLRQLHAEWNDAQIDAGRSLENFNAKAREVRTATRPDQLSGRIHRLLETMQEYNQLLTTGRPSTDGPVTLAERLSRINTGHAQASAWMRQTQAAVSKTPFPETLDRIARPVDRSVAVLDRIDQAVQPGHLGRLQSARQRIQSFNARLEALNRRLEAPRSPAPTPPGSKAP